MGRVPITNSRPGATGYLGIAGRERPLHRRLVLFHDLANERAVEIMPVEGDGPARQAGLREGDLIVAINECMVNSIDYLHRFLADWPIGDPVTLTVLRGKERFTLKVSPVEAK